MEDEEERHLEIEIGTIGWVVPQKLSYSITVLGIVSPDNQQYLGG